MILAARRASRGVEMMQVWALLSAQRGAISV